MSGVILVVGALALAGKGINFGIDFESRHADHDAARAARERRPGARRARAARLRGREDPGGRRARSRQERRPDRDAEQLEPGEVAQRRRRRSTSEFGVVGADFSSNSIGPTFGEQIARTALIAIIASLLLISIYIGLRFEFKFAVPVLIALCARPPDHRGRLRARRSAR